MWWCSGCNLAREGPSQAEEISPLACKANYCICYHNPFHTEDSPTVAEAQAGFNQAVPSWTDPQPGKSEQSRRMKKQGRIILITAVMALVLSLYQIVSPDGFEGQV